MSGYGKTPQGANTAGYPIIANGSGQQTRRSNTAGGPVIVNGSGQPVTATVPAQRAATFPLTAGVAAAAPTLPKSPAPGVIILKRLNDVWFTVELIAVDYSREIWSRSGVNSKQQRVVNSIMFDANVNQDLYNPGAIHKGVSLVQDSTFAFGATRTYKASVVLIKKSSTQPRTVGSVAVGQPLA